jgi:hypothetical protein
VAGPEGEDKRARGFMRVLAQTDARVAQAMRNRGAPYVFVRRVSRANADGSEGSEQTEQNEQNEQNAADLLYTAVYDATGTALADAWLTRYDELVAFYGANGTIPPQSTPGGLGTWVITQRQRRATMSSERKARLEALPWWVWSVRATPVRVAWDARFDELVAFYEANGVTPFLATPGGLGKWVAKQRTRRATMDADRKARLEALPWWVWDTLQDAWSTRYDELVAFYVDNGTLPPQSTLGGLGMWATTQRMRRETMPPERKARLEALEWWAWNVLADAWSPRFDELVAYHAEHGRLPPRSTEGALGAWVIQQRTERATMAPERKARLEALPWWTWDVHGDAWSTRLDELVAYHAEHGMIPLFATPGGLGTWVVTQRQARATMTPERKARLEALPWWVWDPLDYVWSTKLDELVAYHAEHGRLPTQKTAGGLGAWVTKQRTKRATMAPENKARLEALEWWVWSVPRCGTIAP